ncbi:hypothetical protein [Brucella anthropi]|uniref:hypothetical protein n=1 Tax=Brucella anthropi TaxID=529 RepID=UPI00124ED809|nr:hypothetical protein [Brucella anthropi]KAB2740643.1 hypothetical protein F9K89_04550 [Brucella anthropi]
MTLNQTKNPPTKTRMPSFDYKAAGLDQKQIANLEQCRAEIASLGRRTTEQAFDLGAHLAKASELVPDGAFGKWVSACCGFTDRSARNYVAIHIKLATYRVRLSDIGAAPTVLFELTKAEPDQIERALLIASDNGRLQVKDVRKILQVDEPTPADTRVDPFEVGGIGGLNALMQIKIRDGLRSFEKHVQEIVAVVETAVAQKAKGKRLIKDDLAERIKMVARYADAELCNLALAVAPNPAVPVRIEQGRYFPKTSEWETVRQLLVQLSVKEQWPPATELASWFMNKVLPVMNWAIAKNDPGTLQLGISMQPAGANISNVVSIKSSPKAKPGSPDDIDAFGSALDHAFNRVSKAAEPYAD